MILRRNVHIRTRIALRIAAFSSALLILMAVGVIGVFQQQLFAGLDDVLSVRAESNQQLIDFGTTPPSLRLVDDPNRELLTGEAVLRLYAVDGTLLTDASPETGVTPDERAAVLAVAPGRDVRKTVDLADDEDYRVVAKLVGNHGTGPVVLVTGLEQSRASGPLRTLRIILAIAIPATVAGTALGGYWVARRALQPVSEMTTTAQHITRYGDLSKRVPGSDTGDELGHLAATLNVMIERINDTVERERRFTADASHELRTPLAAIEAGIDVTLANERSGDEYRRVLAIVRGQTRRLDRLANQLLLLSRLDGDDVRQTFAPIELNGLLEAVAESFTSAHPRAAFVTDIPADSVAVWGDNELLARAVMNVLENSVTHAGDDAAIVLGLRRDLSRVVITIEDDGPGIPPAFADSVFRRFRRVDGHVVRGTGLGLSIVQAIVECHGGIVAFVAPNRSDGARLEIVLPATDESRSGG